jgi:hypothetical protein
MLRSELIDIAVEAMHAVVASNTDFTIRDMADACLHVTEPLLRADEREKWRADLQSAIDLLSESNEGKP